MAGDTELILSSEDEHMDHPIHRQVRLKGWIIGKRGIDERQDGYAEQEGRDERVGDSISEGQEGKKRIDVIDVIQLVFIRVTVLCSCVLTCVYL